MNVSQVWRRSLWTCGLSLVAVSVAAQAPSTAKPSVPAVGQPGKDVVWVPTPQALVDRMLDMANVTSKDYVIDLGSGDGRLVISAAKRGAKAHGIEYDADLVKLSQRSAEAEGVRARATFAKADIFVSDFSRASVITMFLLPEINLKLRPRILALKPGTRIVSNSFDMEDWEPDDAAAAGADCKTWCTAYFWIVPAHVGGTWRLPTGELELRQQFQRISGTLKNGSTITPIVGATLRGDAIGFTANGIEYKGRVNGRVMQGTAAGGARTTWRATRSGPSR